MMTVIEFHSDASATYTIRAVIFQNGRSDFATKNKMRTNWRRNWFSLEN